MLTRSIRRALCVILTPTALFAGAMAVAADPAAPRVPVAPAPAVPTPAVPTPQAPAATTRPAVSAVEQPAVARPVAPTQPSSKDTTATPDSVLGLGPARAAGSTILPLQLGKRFESPANGISVCPPEGFTGITEFDRDQIVRFVDDLKKPNWSLVVTRRTFQKPQKLIGGKDKNGVDFPGVVDNTLIALQHELPGAKVLRAGDPTNIGKINVGMIVLRYTKNGERRLAQHAIIEANDQVYYLLAFNTPGRKDLTEDNNVEEKTVDPTEQLAVESFRSVVDSVQLLDLGKVREDQIQRLFRTRSLMTNLTEKKLINSIVPEQYLRILKGRKDVGYSYMVELYQRDGGTLPNGKRMVGPDGIRVGICTRQYSLSKEGKLEIYPRSDSEAWMFSSFDRKNEEWSKIDALDDGRPKTPENPWRKVTEVGTSTLETRRIIFDRGEDDSTLTIEQKRLAKEVRKGEVGDRNQPWIENRDNYTLNVNFLSSKADMEPILRKLPPFYLPQNLNAMLPRLVPLNEPKGYLFATYVSDMREIVLRYIDVGVEQDLPPVIANNAKRSRGVPVQDRLRLEGLVTTHWFSPKGDYLGSITMDTMTIILPTDFATLQEIWKGQEINRPFVDPSRDFSRQGLTDRPTLPRGVPAPLPGSIGNPPSR